MRASRVLFAVLFVVIATLALWTQAPAQDYPSRPVTVVVPFAPGGGVDQMARLVSGKLEQRLGKSFIIENKPGAGSIIAATYVQKAAPDGHTLLMAPAPTMAVNVSLYKNLPYDPTTDFSLIGLLSGTPFVLMVNVDLPVKSVPELLAYAKANPGKMTFASAGPGVPHHLFMELFKGMTGMKASHVPYRGSLPALNDLVAGHVDLIFMQLEAAIKLHQGGKARILAVTTEKRVAMLPDIPTMAEVGLKDFISDTWNAITAPPKTPAPIIAKLNTAVNDALKLPEVQAQYKRLGLQPGGGTPQHLGDIIKSDTKRWGDVIREAKIPQI